jgi:hypothetical protein
MSTGHTGGNDPQGENQKLKPEISGHGALLGKN